MKITFLLTLAAATTLLNCSRIDHIGKPPDLTPQDKSVERQAMIYSGLPVTTPDTAQYRRASLWSGDQSSLFGDRRAYTTGDILTVIIEINDKAEISNTTSRGRSGSEALGVAQLFGLPQRKNKDLPEGAGLDTAVDLESSSQSKGNGSVRRNEKLTLRIAATVTGVLPNGVLRIEGTQEVRVNFELRELLVSGFVRRADITRQNEITYDKIASARISYGGRGQISDVQQPRYGQQMLDAVLPF
ncbi:flagellar basal body L-ring protein FlgH [Marivita sp. GX14005]|uniref:flagellar basal body L-ring protein FlgH n=1 Tax=Marivita sp. GX14005 TaxID=2942276 RepID=UPI0020188308|nr:flagellar basal body L-ring protein FlgH [Marivita sp. GX14005]MCL3881696.1 flagellar basal body L-ring protein FlgH [Marivita sp. GX14005]